MIEKNIVYTVFPKGVSVSKAELSKETDAGADKVCFEIPMIDRKEALRYAGFMMKKGEPKGGLSPEGQGALEPELEKLFEEAAEEAERSLDYKLCFMKSTVSECEVLKNFEDTLGKPSEYIMFAATVGHSIDRLIARYERLQPSKALLLQGIGAERVEALCDAFQEELSRMYQGCITRRVSPGYGKLKLELQKDFFDILDINRKIGISLGESLLMTPSKSVTAVFGITGEN